MTVLSREELYALAKGAGFTGKDVDIAVAVALAESGGNPKAHNSTYPDDSYGLWQINMLGSMGPARRAEYGLKSNADLYDPSINARVAYAIFKRSGWSPWTTYTRGTYKKHMTDGGGTATEYTPRENTPQLTADETGGLFGIGTAINSFGETFTKGFASFGAVIVAVVLLVLGVVILARKQVTAVIPGGKLAKVAKVAKGVAG